MMKAIQFIPDILQLFRKFSYEGASRFNFLDDLTHRIQKQNALSYLSQALQNIMHFPIKGTLIYLSKAFGEGLKQNLFGPNVDTEFVALTIKVYVTAFVKLIAHNQILNSIKFFIK